MKLLNVLSSLVIRFGKVAGKSGGNIYALNLTKQAQQRYGFLQSPQRLEEFDLNSGITFLHGYFQERVVIDKFQVYNNGLSAEGSADTDILEAFLDDVTSWATETGGFLFEIEPARPRYFQSTLEVHSTASPASALPQFAPLGKAISDILKEYSIITPEWQTAGISFGSGMSGDAASFRFERREGSPPPENTYYAFARMRTKDHLKVLEKLEELMTSAS